MQQQAPSKSDVIERVGLSEFSIHVYNAMNSKSNPLKINHIFRIVCPNKEIRSLSKDEVRKFQPCVTQSPPPTTPKKPVKKNDDELRKMIVREREKEIIANGVIIAGTVNAKKALPLVEKDARLIWEFLGWGQTSSNFYVFLYYIGPANKGKECVELSKHENWMMVPETHLAIFHKSMGPIYNKLQQTPLNVKESIENKSHIEYDVRYVLYKWKKCTNITRKEQVEYLNQYMSLFECKDTLRVKEHKKRKLDKISQVSEVQPQKSPKLEPLTSPHEREYEVKTPKYRSVVIDEYIDVTRYPLGQEGITFQADQLDKLVRNAILDNDRHPSSYKWDPTQTLVKPWMLVSSLVRLRKQMVITMIKKYNLCFESDDFNAIYEFINNNKDACHDLKLMQDSFTWSYSLFNILVTRGLVPDEVDDALKKLREQEATFIIQ